jgi:3-deoxy-manno-octulosonate cytidylyltransferase (CMP-KDO synthetase)
MFAESEKNRSMIFNPLIVVASELGIGRAMAKSRSDAERQSTLVRTYRRVTSSELGSVIVDSIDEEGAAAAAADGAYTVRTDPNEFGRTHNYRSNSGAERIAATVNRFDRFYSHDIVIAVPDDMPKLQPFYIQALMYALATSEVGIATLVTPLEHGELENNDITKVAVNWNPDRIVYPLEGSRVGTLVDIRRDSGALRAKDCCKLVPIHAWRRAALDRVVRTPPSEREFAEGTDLVRALEAGIRIDVAFVTENMKVLMTPAELRGETTDMGH